MDCKLGVHTNKYLLLVAVKAVVLQYVVLFNCQVKLESFIYAHVTT